MAFEKPKKILGGENGYTDEEFGRLELSDKARILGYMWSQNLGGLIKTRPPEDDPHKQYSLTFLTMEELADWNKDETQKYVFLDTSTAMTLNQKAISGGRSYTNMIIHYARDYMIN